MVDIQYWQLGADILLVTALIFLAVRFTRSSASYLQFRSNEMQSGLKMLIKEAENAGKVLDDTLVKRQKQLESLLMELESANQQAESFERKQGDLIGNLNTRVEQANKQIASLERLIEAAKSFGNSNLGEQDIELERNLANSADQQQYSNPAYVEPRNAAKDLTTAGYHESYMQAAEPPSFQSQRTASDEAPQTHARARSYGNEPSPKGRRGLERNIEFERTDSPSAQSSTTGALENVYEAAEKMIRAGYDLNTIAQKTKLPANALKAMEQMISKRNEPRVEASIKNDSTIDRESPIFDPDQVDHTRNDERLGVLGGIKRQRYTV